jgi:hypothetical protein
VVKAERVNRLAGAADEARACSVGVVTTSTSRGNGTVGASV